jgi:hypothetical protein
MGHHSWYKFFGERQWAEHFLQGEVLFRSLAIGAASRLRDID